MAYSLPETGKNSVPNCMSDASETGTGFLLSISNKCVMAYESWVDYVSDN